MGKRVCIHNNAQREMYREWNEELSIVLYVG